MAKLDYIRQRHAAATPGPWKGHINYPFYGVVEKPAPSLSKHDDERPRYWRYQDAIFTVNAHTDMTYLFHQIVRLSEALQKCQENAGDINLVGAIVEDALNPTELVES
jgi:hypothetical protein